MISDVIIVKGEVFPTVVAVTLQEQARGLMGQKSPHPIMTFPYHDKSVHKFWMSNTYVPLDIVFCCDDSVVGIVKGEPLSTALIGPNVASNLVVEFPAGMVEKLSLGVGDEVRLQPTLETMARMLQERTKTGSIFSRKDTSLRMFGSSGTF